IKEHSSPNHTVIIDIRTMYQSSVEEQEEYGRCMECRQMNTLLYLLKGTGDC
ncbi:3563_t:CDS:2, partial [Rhizophagus irregularis]